MGVRGSQDPLSTASIDIVKSGFMNPTTKMVIFKTDSLKLKSPAVRGHRNIAKPLRVHPT